MDMNMIARRDVVRREADDLVVFADRLPGADRRRRHLVPSRNGRGGGNPFRRQGGAGHQRQPGDHNIVRRMQADAETLGSGHWLCPSYRAPARGGI